MWLLQAVKMRELLRKTISPILNLFVAHLLKNPTLNVNSSFFFFLVPLKQSNSRSVGADYMGKVSYQDSMREQMAVANSNTTGLKAPGMQLSTGTKR